MLSIIILEENANVVLKQSQRKCVAMAQTEHPQGTIQVAGKERSRAKTSLVLIYLCVPDR